MPKVIQSGELWPIERLPQIPDWGELPAGFKLSDGLTVKQAEELGHALDLMRLIDREDGTRRTTTGINRAGQNRWPDRGIWIGDTEILVNAWRIAGWVTLANVIMQPKCEVEKGKFAYVPAIHTLESLAVAVVDDVSEKEEVFLPGMTAAAILEHRAWSYYRVAAKTNWGIYKFVIMHHIVPQWNDVYWYCRWHTVVPC